MIINQTIAISIIFDSSYIEPALVSAYSILNANIITIHKVHLIFLHDNSDEDVQASIIISTFVNKFDEGNLISIIAVKNSLPKFNKFHFSNAIIYKALIPSIIQHEKYIINLDAGILIGKKFAGYLQDVIIACINTENSNWIIGAISGPPPKEYMPDELKDLPSNRIYPAGAIILFNGEAFKINKFYERYVGNYLNLVSKLKYAEQELMCLTLLEGELIVLPDSNEMIYHHLSLDAMSDADLWYNETIVENCICFKIFGSLKPWHYCVLDPNKIVWLLARAGLESIMPLGIYPLIEKNRNFILHPDFVSAFQRKYEILLLSRFAMKY